MNAPSGTITALAGAQTGNRYINASLDNQGTITASDVGSSLQVFLPTDAVWENTGSILLGSTSISFLQSGPSASFTNRGSITIAPSGSGSGRVLSVQNGSFTHAAGATLNGGGNISFGNVDAAFDDVSTLGFLQQQGGTITLGSGVNVVGTSMRLLETTVTGPETLTVSAGDTLQLEGATVSAPFAIEGTLLVTAGVGGVGGVSSIDGPLTTNATSVVKVASGGTIDAALTVASGFTNSGLIELSNISGFFGSALGAALTVTSGTLVNALGATIRARTGDLGNAGGGLRTLTAQLDNQGTLDIYPDSAGLFTINGNVTTSGIINVDVGGLTAGTQYGRVAVNGTLSLGGTLNVGLFGGYVPVSTNAFTILTSTGATTGTFTTSNLTAPLALPITYAANAVTVGVP